MERKKIKFKYWDKWNEESQTKEQVLEVLITKEK